MVFSPRCQDPVKNPTKTCGHPKWSARQEVTDTLVLAFGFVIWAAPDRGPEHLL